MYNLTAKQKLKKAKDQVRETGLPVSYKGKDGFKITVDDPMSYRQIFMQEGVTEKGIKRACNAMRHKLTKLRDGINN